MRSLVVRRLFNADLWSSEQRGSPAKFSVEGRHVLIATVSAVTICMLLGTTSILIPPAMYSDSGWGFLAGRGTLLNELNCLVLPNPVNIATDLPTFYTAQSPGQYLLPGIISLSGVKLGVAIALTSMLSLLLSLIGWIKIFHKFAPDSKDVILAAIAIGTFRYSTLPFGIYNGGEILLQAATPWIILGTLKVPRLPLVPAGLLSGALVVVAFLMKETGLIVVGSGLIAGGLVALRRSHRIMPGMLGGAIGALVAVGAVYELFLSRGWTPVSTQQLPPSSQWSFFLDGVMFSVVAPWTAGFSWTDLLAWIFLHPGRELVHSWSIMILLMLPSAVVVASLVLLGKPRTENETDFRRFAFGFYGVTLAVFVFLYIHGADIGYEERHFRSAGTLLFVAALFSSTRPRVSGWMKYGFLALVGLMSLYGLASFSSHALAMADGHSLDRTSWTNQPLVDQSAIRYLQEEYVHEGRDALFVIPSPILAVTMPLEARLIAVHIDFQRETQIAALRYRGRVPGHIFVLIQDRIADSSKGKALLRAFIDYNPQNWTRRRFSSSSIFIQ